MIVARPADARGEGAHGGWLDSRHTFSFGHYYDPAWMGFGALRVINEDRVAPGAGFAEHGHANMEIVSLVLSGRLEHRDDHGGGGVIAAGDVQYMSAGSGVRHSEYNASQDEPVHFLQVWIQPDRSNTAPRYAQRTAQADDRDGRWAWLVAPDGREGSLAIRQDATLRQVHLAPGAAIDATLLDGRRYWLQLVSGSLEAPRPLQAGDALGLHGEPGPLQLRAGADGAHVLLFDLPGA